MWRLFKLHWLEVDKQLKVPEMSKLNFKFVCFEQIIRFKKPYLDTHITHYEPFHGKGKINATKWMRIRPPQS